jgi:hypothetical protein
MRKQPEIEGALKSFIRDELAKNPLASVETIRAELYRCGYYSIYRGQLDWHYISKLMRKVRVENIARLSTEDRRARWAAVRERHRILTEKMMSIVNAKMVRTVKGDGYPTVHDQIAAASVVMKWDVAMLWAETQLNLIEKPEAIEKKHTREVIVMDTVSETRVLGRPGMSKTSLNNRTPAAAKGRELTVA